MLISCRWLSRHVSLDGIDLDDLAADAVVQLDKAKRPLAKKLVHAKNGFKPYGFLAIHEHLRALAEPLEEEGEVDVAILVARQQAVVQ